MATHSALPRAALKVLLVDDDSFQTEMLTEALHSLGVRDVVSAHSGAQALQQLQGVQVVLLDLHMPGMDGFQFMEAASQKGFAGALIIVSGQSEEVMRGASLVSRLRRFNLLGTLAKPVDRSALGALLAQFNG